MGKSIRVLLVFPPTGIRNALVGVPLGLLYLSSFLKQQLGNAVTVRLTDLRISSDPLRELAAALDTFLPDLVGVSLFSLHQNAWDPLLAVIERHAPKARIIVGGPFPTANWQKALQKCPGIECAVVGEGEIVLARLVAAFINNEDIRGIKGIAYRDGNRLVCNEKEPYIHDLNSIPFPDYSLILFERYWSPSTHQMNGVLAEKRYTQIISSRGCPFNCIYCHNIFGKQMRTRSTENFLCEIRMLYDQL